MNRRSVADPEMEVYAARHSTPPSARLAAVADSTRVFSDYPAMMIDEVEGKLLSLLVALTGTRRILEIGTFTGYSAISMAESLPADGHITSLELSPEHAAKSREHIADAGFSDRITVLEGPALGSLATLEGPFDLSFIDADKPAYPAYYDAIVPLMRPGGLIVADNVLREGRVLEAETTDPGIVGIREFNDRAAADPRVECVMLTIRDGVTLIRRRD
jgi:caffeoyl-CoA O-methyltransferase